MLGILGGRLQDLQLCYWLEVTRWSLLYLALDGCRLCVFGLPDCTHELLIKTKMGKTDGWPCRLCSWHLPINDNDSTVVTLIMTTCTCRKCDVYVKVIMYRPAQNNYCFNPFTPKIRKLILLLDDHTFLLHYSDDDFHSGCQNVSHCHRQQSFSGLPSPGQSHYMIDCHSQVQTLYCNTFLCWLVLRIWCCIKTISPSWEFS